MRNGLFVWALLALLAPAPAPAADVFIYALTPDRPEMSEERYRADILQKGDMASCWPHGSQGIEYAPGEDRTVMVRVTDLSLAECQGLLGAWVRNIDFTVVNHFTSQDAYRIDAWAVIPGVSEYGNLTREKIENYLNLWNGVYRSAPDANTVRFDVGIYEMAISDGYWDGHNVANVLFAETAYDTGTGWHTITADYSGTPFVGKADQVNDAIEDRGGVIISNDGDIVVYQVLRGDILAVFKWEVQEKLADILWGRRFYFAEADVDTVINNPTTPRHMEITRAQWDNSIKDRTLDP